MKVKLRTPNELFYDEVEIDPKDFEPTGPVFDDEGFGKYRKMTVAMDIESYNKIKENEESRDIQ
jgi:hypothetical protein